LYRRARGYRVWHLHWVHDWVPSWAAGTDGGRRLAQAWFSACLFWGRLIGYRLVWTAHNVTPHERTFFDDRAACRRLASSARAVAVHSEASRRAVEALGAREVVVVGQGPLARRWPLGSCSAGEARRRLALPEGRLALHLGAIRPYKGTDRLIDAVVDRSPRLTLVVAGSCPDAGYRSALERAAARSGGRVVLRFGFVPDDDLELYMAAADAAVYAFRSVTNSGSVRLALEFGLPVVIPDLEVFEEVPAGAALRYPNTDGCLAEALLWVARTDREELARMAAGASRFRPGEWSDAAEQTRAVYTRVCRPGAAG
jgi:glycosyltransferase involved in cell wall biosynthesis